MSRITVTARLLIVAGLVTWSAFALTDPNSGTGSLLINLGTEIVGIVITVAVVEWFFERRRALERGRQVAWSAMHAAEHVVWVWQGGPREVEADQLLGILRAVSPDDALPDFTQNLLLGLGTRSKHTLHNDQSALQALPGLMNAFEELARLNAIREGGRVTPARKVADILEAGVAHLARSLGQPAEPIPARLIRYVDATESAQEQRYFGGTADELTPRRLQRPAGELF
jgi:hypothetical protein